MLKVLMTADTVGGVWIYSLDLARELAQGGVQVVLATMGHPLTREQQQSICELTREIPSFEIRESSFRLEWMLDRGGFPWRDIAQAGDWLLELAEEFQPDLIHLNNYCHAHLPWDQPTLLVAHSDVYSWFHAVKKTRPNSEWKRYHQEVSAGLRSAHRIITPTEAVKEDLRREYGEFGDIKVIPNGRDFKLFQSKIKERFILTAGRIWDEAKNIRILDEIASSLPAPIYAAGSANNPDGIPENMLKKLNHLHLLGQIPPRELSDFFARALIYALPAKYEPFGLSILEAASCGCALVLGNIPSLRENWQNAAVFVDPNDPADLQVALHQLLNDKDLCRFLGNQARERSKFFSLRRMGLAYLQEYRSLVKPSLPLSQNQFIPSDLKIREI